MNRFEPSPNFIRINITLKTTVQPRLGGEPGCSHRLFLVAFIIAAKYRCSVELSPSLPEDMDTQEEGHENLERRDIHGEFSGSRIKHEQVDHSLASFEQTLEARLNAELIFSNHAWVRLLNLGSFYRQPPTATTNPAAAAASSSSTLSQSSLHDQPTGVAAAAAASGPTPPPSATSPTQPQVTSLMSIIHSASGSSPAVPMAMLQVEDLDRMEAEFLTFLNFDLATMSHDLQTCWDLLVGKNEAS
ncbi:hypothetical protein BGZ58_001045 [Dissophora ornata]|nr:hypothetical protein BGZ58_001045 [Dissophora ornata]